MVRLTDRPDMTLDVYRGREATTQQIHLPIILLKIYQNVFGGLIPRLNLIKKTKCRSLG